MRWALRPGGRRDPSCAVTGSRQPPSAPAPVPGAAQPRHPVSDTITAAGGWLRCTVCGHALGAYGTDLLRIGAVRELPLRSLGERFARCRPDYVAREYACPGCGTAFAVDVQDAAEPLLEGARLRGDPS